MKISKKLINNDNVNNVKADNQVSSKEEFNQYYEENKFDIDSDANKDFLKKWSDIAIGISDPLRVGNPPEISTYITQVFMLCTDDATDFALDALEKKLNANFEEDFSSIIRDVLSNLPDKNKYVDLYDKKCQCSNMDKSFGEFLFEAIIPDIVEYCRNKYVDEIASKEPNKFYKVFGDMQSTPYIWCILVKCNKPLRTLIYEYSNYLKQDS